jgi:hypothetical protein
MIGCAPPVSGVEKGAKPKVVVGGASFAAFARKLQARESGQAKGESSEPQTKD